MVFEKILTFIHILRCTASILFMLLGACRLYKNLSFFYMIEAKNASIILKKTFWIIVCLSLATCLSIGLAFSESDPSESSNWDKVVGSILFTGTMVLWIYYGCYLTEIILRGLGSASAENDDNFGFSNPDLKQPTPAKEEIKKPQEKIPKEKEDQKPLPNQEGIGQDQESLERNEIGDIMDSLIERIEREEGNENENFSWLVPGDNRTVPVFDEAIEYISPSDKLSNRDGWYNSKPTIELPLPSTKFYWMRKSEKLDSEGNYH